MRDKSHDCKQGEVGDLSQTDEKATRHKRQMAK